MPAGLGQLSAPLHAFTDFFEIDQDLIVGAAQNSPPLKTTNEPLEPWVPLLPETERTTFLVRAARGESVVVELLRRLREVGDAPRPALQLQRDEPLLQSRKPPKRFVVSAKYASNVQRNRNG